MRRHLLSALALLLIAATVAFIFQQNQRPSGNRPPKADKILVEKAARRLTLFSAGRKLKEYRVALGFSPIGPKEREGDGRTPEGIYIIDFHKPDSAFHRALHVSYPSAEDSARAAEAGVSPGGDIMIHGLPSGLRTLGAAHRWRDWTAGCIAVTDPEIDEIYSSVNDGTSIEIQP
ncbi:MAG TPA: L,D-transpeptidase family protein [Chthoniobacterales bacterium]|nr:L,D-transpeptidase family protein [Chthoniobacterales bacterium]